MIDLTTGVYIPSVDAKDIYLSAHYYNYENHEYDLKLKDGNYNLRKFINTLDYSLDLIELLDIYYKKYRKNDFLFTVKKHKYTTNVINLTFKYSVKEWNQMNKNTFVKFGYNYRDLTFDDCIAKNNTGEIVGIQINSKVKNKLEIPSPFVVKKVEIKDKKDKSIVKEVQLQYKKKGEPKTLKTNAQLRSELYKNGFTCNGVKYCRMKRSTGSARVGKCLFINESLFKSLLNFSSGAIRLNPGDEIDLAAYEGYIALPSSSIIDTLPIKPENILLIDDYDSVFNEDVIETHDENNWLKTTEKNCTITNTIWDGQSLMDISLFGDYSEYGMVLLRNLMFKSCCFNCNIQQWFKDNNITDISQLNGKTRATKIEDVKLITTPNSIKYLKFSTWDEWLDNLYPNFGVVKHDKKTHFFEGRLVQTHYQLLNTLQMSKDEVNEFLSEALDFAQLLRNNPEVVRYYIKYPDIDELDPLSRPMNSKNDVVYNLMSTGLKNAKELYNKGLVGTDDFKSFAKMISPTGATDVANFEENYNKAKRYLTDNDKGVKNFLNDLKSKGLATYSDSEGWNIGDIDLKRDSRAMGIGKDFMSNMFGRLEDYGFHNNVFSTTEEGVQKLSEAYKNLFDSQSRVKDLEKNDSGNATAIQGAKDDVEAYKADIEQIKNGFSNVTEDTADQYSAEIDAAHDQAEFLEKQREEVLLDKDGKYGDKAKQIASMMEADIDELKSKYEDSLDDIDVKTEKQIKKEAKDKENANKDATSDNPSTPDFGNDEQSKKTYDDVFKQIKDAKDNNDRDVQQAIDTLSNFTADQVNGVDLFDGKYDSDELKPAEQALDSLKEKFQLTDEQAQMLGKVFESMGVLKPETDTSDVDKVKDDAKEAVDDLNEISMGWKYDDNWWI